MEIKLSSNNLRVPITPIRKQILDRIVCELFESEFGQIYREDDIKYIQFHYKGHPKLVSFLVVVELNFIESEDVVVVIDYKFHRIDSKLSFLTINRNGEFGGNSLINFWYYLSEEDASAIQ